KSPVKIYSQQFLYHIILQPKAKFAFEIPANQEAAAFIPLGDATVNCRDFGKSELIGFANEEGTVEFTNKGISPVDIIVFGGEHYNEPIVGEGPFVMNSRHEISQAYRDFFDGKYGEIQYS
ncbi:MAG TPA: pirin-like C-terminal cupin domain-containing protein, partial [Ohtaekwangia sp.]|uniref:pirin-like C-terminal cupin domain-containing protein n=1 Tax=Ohtaekwangia sp. TaxID=2066019 RepID=UPI002F93AFDD